MGEMKWEEYYPHVVVPGRELDPEEDLKTFNSLFLNVVHSVPPRTPLFAYYCARVWSHSMQYAPEQLCIPGTRGIDYRHYKGRLYLGLLIVRDEEEKKRREPEFKKRMGWWLENFDERWEEAKKELIKGFEEIKSFDFNNASAFEMIEWLHTSFLKALRMFEIHMELMYPCFSAYLIFSDFMQDHFGIQRTDPEFQRMLTGFDNKLYQINKNIFDLGWLAVKEGLEPVFAENEPKDILSKLRETQAGKSWVEDYMKFLEADGWWPLTMMEFNCPNWVEDPSIVLGTIKSNLEQKAEFDLTGMREELGREREKTVNDLESKLPKEERDYFRKLVNLAARASSWQEEHTYYCEYAYHASLRYGYVKIAEKLAQAGAIKQPDDIFFLIPPEIETALATPERTSLTRIVDARRSLYEEWLATPTPLFYTVRKSLQEAVEKDLLPSYDPVMISHVIGEQPVVREELKADLYGVCGSPGRIEGLARVIKAYTEMDKVKKGEILITVSTDPNWMPVFPLIKGAVTEQGGVLAHTSITAREFGIPAVVGARDATKKIKTGQKIRIDADQGAVYILGDH
jgi:pyruvate,water dikinase